VPLFVGARLPGVESGAQGLVTELVVELLFFRVGQHVEGGADLFEALLGLGVVRLDVRMQLAGQPAILLLDLVDAGGAAHSEGGVQILHRP
jgi:hypothetical protein